MNWHRSRPPAIFTLLRLVSLHLLALPSPASRCAAGPRREHRQPVPAAGCPVPRGRGRGTRRVGGCAARPRSLLPACRSSLLRNPIPAHAWHSPPPSLPLLVPWTPQDAAGSAGGGDALRQPRLSPAPRRCRPPALLPQNISSIPVSQLLPSSLSPAAPARRLGVSPVPATPSVRPPAPLLSPIPSRQAGAGRRCSSFLLLSPALFPAIRDLRRHSRLHRRLLAQRPRRRLLHLHFPWF